MLKQPYLRTEGRYFADYIKLWERFSDNYNKGRKLGKQLRGHHKQMYFRLVHQAKRTIYLNNKHLAETGQNALDSTKPVSIRTTRPYLGKALGVSGATVCRHINRLEDAGVLAKIGHGTRRPFELLINPDFLLIFDYNDEQYSPSSCFLETENKEPQGQLRSNCTHVSCKPDPFNKIIIAVDNSTDKAKNCVPPSGDNLKEQTGANNWNTRKQENPEEKSKQNFESFSSQLKSPLEQKKEKSCAKKEKKGEEQTLGQFRRSLAQRMYLMMVQLLFKYHNIYPTEKENAICYIEQVYMSQVQDGPSGIRTLGHYRWRLLKAASYITRKNYDYSNVYPMHYLNVNNPTGFAATKAWAARAEKESRKKKIKRITDNRNLTDRKKLEKIIKKFNGHPNLSTYQTCEMYIKQNIPHLFAEFVAATNITHVST